MSRGHVSFRDFVKTSFTISRYRTKHSISNFGSEPVPVSGTLVTYNATVAIKL